MSAETSPHQDEKNYSLLIISDTPMYSKDGIETAIFEPTLREVEALSQLFHSIKWMGFDHGNSFPANVRCSHKKEIDFIRLPKATGGDHWYNKLRIIRFIPGICWIIIREIRKFNFIHTRGPSLPAAIAILANVFTREKKFWHKYAGNWRQRNPPFSYGLQRWLLKRSDSFIAVNGCVENDSPYIRQFENPCFYKNELEAAAIIANDKIFGDQINLLFVGRMEREKGAFTILEAMPKLSSRFSLTMVGIGKDMEEIEALVNQTKSQVAVLGALSRVDLDNLYTAAHLIVLPTVASEGFPKVLAEAAGYGCIPMVTALSSIPDYIKDGVNGFLLGQATVETLINHLSHLPKGQKLKEISRKAQQMAALFTYEQYLNRIESEFLNNSG